MCRRSVVGSQNSPVADGSRRSGCVGRCADFLYGFKAARQAARAAAAARSPSLPLTLPLRRRKRRSAGAKDHETQGRHERRVSQYRLICSRSVIVRAGQNPSRPSVTAGQPHPVKLPGERTREDGPDRTCPKVPEFAAIGSRDTSGQDGRTADTYSKCQGPAR
jgi:hypothetical protein